MNLSVVSKDNTSNTKYTFTDDQKKAIDNIIDFIGKPFSPANYIVGLTGAGGTGKTFITRYIISHCKYSSSVIKCTAPTHKACRVFSQAIGGKKVDTVQSTFGLRLNLRLEDFDPNHPQFDPLSSVKLQNIKLLIIDESSMIPAKLVTFICNKCKEFNIKILYIGDSFQLAPVNEHRSIAFDRCVKVNPLNEVVRQAAENPINDLLTMLRYDISHRGNDFLNYVSNHRNETIYNDKGEGYSICNAKQFKELIDESFTDDEYKSNIDMYRVVAYTNICISSWNNYIRSHIIPNAQSNIITKNDLIMSYETIVDEFNEIVINNSEEYIINDIVNFVDSKYGFKGFLVKFQLVHGGNICDPLFIIDHKDKNSIIMYNNTINELKTSAMTARGTLRASKWKEFYAFKKKYLLATNIINRQGQIIYNRDIDYGFAITAHKSQGSTYDNVFVDVNDMVYSKTGIPYADKDDMLRRLYVACSRARKQLVLCYGM